MSLIIEPSWRQVLEEELKKPYFKALWKEVENSYSHAKIYPPKQLVFNALEQCPFDKVKVVILGQDPYHGPYQAHGLSFSVPRGIKIPPSLRNIYKEIIRDCGDISDTTGDLTHWAEQGVLLLNSTFTVEAGKAGSHQKIGWEDFTDELIRLLADKRKDLVFMLWGSYAQKKAKGIDKSKHLVLESVHPSPLSAHRGFIGNGHFSKCNDFLRSKEQEEIAW